MVYRILIFALFASWVQSAGAQQLERGGLLGEEFTVLTPSGELNEQISSALTLEDTGVMDIDRESRAITIRPEYLQQHNWILVRNAPFLDGDISFFVNDSWLYTDGRIQANTRRRRFSTDVTDRIRSNAYHLAYHREQVVENEIILFIVSPSTQTVYLEVDPELLGQERTLAFDMQEGEGRLIHIVIPPDEYTVVTWAPENVTRATRTLDGKWHFHKGELDVADVTQPASEEWDHVAIPHSWNARDVYDTRNVHDGLDVLEWYYRGPGWYQKAFSIPATQQETHFYLHFLGANQVADVWLNGSHLGRHVGGYTGFKFDVTGQIDFERPNVLAVRVDNSFDYDVPPHSADYNFYGGLYREVELISTHPVHVRDTWITTPLVSLNRAKVEVKTTIRNETGGAQSLRLVTNIINPQGEIVHSMVNSKQVASRTEAVFQQESAPLRDPLLWAPEHPWLYQVSSTVYDERGLALDQTFEPLGFRRFEFDADRGFFLNGEPLKLKGVNFHQDFLNKGFAVGRDQKREDLKHIKRMGANFLRVAHYPHHPYVLHLADSLGMVVWQEIPFINTVGREAFLENTKNMLREMIERDKNHPSIVMWGLGNEFAMPWLAREDVEWALRIITELNELSKDLDPYRLTVQGHNHLADKRIFAATDIQARNRYYGWYEDTYEDFAAALDQDKETNPTWKFIISEYGAEGKYGYHVNNPRIFDHSETYQLDFHRAYWEAIRERDFIAGSALWNMFDFGSTVKIGNIPRINQKGMMTKDRKPKAVYYYYQSQWSSEPMVYVVAHNWNHRYGPEGEPQPIEVFSNCEEVELFHNGSSLGRQPSDGDPLVWSVPYVIGRNMLKAVGRKNGETVRHEIVQFYHVGEIEDVEGPDGPWRTGDELPDEETRP